MIIDISPTVRIEDSPPRKRAVATEELLCNSVTAGHYHAPRPATADEIANPKIDTSDGLVRAIDAECNPIELGQEMAYIDWKCADCDRVWNVYRLVEGVYATEGTFPTMEEANAFAITL